MNDIPDGITRDLAERVLHQGELRLAAQLQIALAADQRAITSASILVAIASACLGFAGEQFTNTLPDQRFAIALVTAGSLLLVSSALCVSAAWPVRFRLVGAVPENWWSDDVIGRPYEECLWKESNNYTVRVRQNVGVIKQNAKRLRKGMYLACAAPFIGLVFWLVDPLCP
jgi:hypothetical protein